MRFRSVAKKNLRVSPATGPPRESGGKVLLLHFCGVLVVFFGGLLFIGRNCLDDLV